MQNGDTHAIDYDRHIYSNTRALRSDSDLYTFSFPWKPWTKGQAIAEGALIQEYLDEAVEEQGIAPHIKFNHKVHAMDCARRAGYHPPVKNRSGGLEARWLPTQLGSALVRFRRTLLGVLFVKYCSLAARVGARKLLLGATEKQLPRGHLTWRPTLCPRTRTPPLVAAAGARRATPTFIPGAAGGPGERASRRAASRRVTERSIASSERRGAELPPPTSSSPPRGSRRRVGGNARIAVDAARPAHIPDLYSWKGAMFEGLPNLFYAFGYVDASWTPRRRRLGAAGGPHDPAARPPRASRR
ncbi:hypothetical protein MY11210_006532 [Beauveria gryllotalpidicola]